MPSTDWTPRSVVTVEGTPNRETRVWTKARATVTAVESAMGNASGHLVKRSMQVRRYTHPLDGGKSPTISICTWSKQASGVAKVPRGVIECQWTLDLWHWMHERAHFRTSELIPGHTKRLVTSRCVARMPGCDIQCSESKMARRKLCEMKGL